MVAATDPNAGTALTYTITAGNTGGAFAFAGNQLQVATREPWTRLPTR